MVLGSVSYIHTTPKTYSKFAAWKRPKGPSTKATYKQRMAEIQAGTETLTQKANTLTQLLGDQTGSGGFQIKNVDVNTGAAAGDTKHMTIVGDDGTTYYIDVRTALA